MSIVISILRDDFAMIAGDTRFTYYHPGGKIEYRDDGTKIFCVGFAWIGSVGLVEFFECFQSLILKGAVKNTDDIPSIFNSVYDRIKNEDSLNMLDSTKVIYSFSFYEEGILRIHIESINPLIGHTGVRDKNVLISFLPEDSLIMSKIKNKYKPLIEKSIDMEEVVYHTACYIEDVASINSTVSKICDIGLTIKESNSKIVQARIRESADVIKQAYKAATLSSLIKEVTVLGS